MGDYTLRMSFPTAERHRPIYESDTMTVYRNTDGYEDTILFREPRYDRQFATFHGIESVMYTGAMELKAGDVVCVVYGHIHHLWRDHNQPSGYNLEDEYLETALPETVEPHSVILPEMVMNQFCACPAFYMKRTTGLDHPNCTISIHNIPNTKNYVTAIRALCPIRQQDELLLAVITPTDHTQTIESVVKGLAREKKKKEEED